MRIIDCSNGFTLYAHERRVSVLARVDAGIHVWLIAAPFAGSRERDFEDEAQAVHVCKVWAERGSEPAFEEAF